MSQTLIDATAHFVAACAGYSAVMAEKGQVVGQPLDEKGLGFLCLYVENDDDLRCNGKGSPELWSEMMLGLARQDMNFRLALAAVFSHLVDAQRLRDGADT